MKTKFQWPKIVLLCLFLFSPILSIVEFISFYIESPKDAVLFENVGGLIIPIVYLGVAACLVLLPWKQSSTQEKWPFLRCLLLFLWAIIGQLPEPLCGAECARAHRLFCLGIDAIFLGRLAIARLRHEQNQDWRYYCALVIFVPIIIP
ncbi:MAG TPA: hypothetical protein VGI63_06040 [Verrucomicrobiae bacterium]|jgi:hypothetical protein